MKIEAAKDIRSHYGKLITTNGCRCDYSKINNI